MKTWKKIVLAAVVLLVVLVVAAAIALSRMIGPAAQRVLTEVVSPAVGARVEAQAIDVSFTGGSCTVRGLVVHDPDNASATLLRMDTITVRIGLLSIFSDVLHVREIRIEGGEANVRLGAGGSNLNALVKNANAARQVSAGGSPAGVLEAVKNKLPARMPALSHDGGGELPAKAGGSSADRAGSSADHAGASADRAGEAAGNAGSSADRAGGPNLVRIDAFDLTGCRLKIASEISGIPPADVPLKDVSVRGIGDPAGVTPQQALSDILNAVVNAAVQTAVEKAGEVAKDRVKGAAESILKQNAPNAGEVMKGLLGR